MSRATQISFTIAIGIALLASLAAKSDLFYPYVAFVLPLDSKPAETILELTLKEKIPLGDVKGRIDHMAVDIARKRLFLAELGNNSLGVIDLQRHRFETRLTGLDEPQGVAFVPGTDTLFIANGGNGVVEMRKGKDLSLIKTIDLGSDADNIRAEGEEQVIVGFGDGGLAVLDAKTGEKREEIPLAAHPESFQLDRKDSRIFVNEPGSFRIAVIDRRSGTELARWEAAGAAANFPMAFDAANERLFVAYRVPALITMFHTKTGELIARLPTCGDSDDVFYDAKRSRVYVICGDGSIAVLATSSDQAQELSRLATRGGARTGYYAPELDLLFVAAPANSESAEILVYEPH
jgi:DNA-binding beta-propeller fold protein YncE